MSLEFGLNDKETSPHREAPNRHERGGRKYKEMVAKGSKEADAKNLPFTFSKPSRATPMTVWCQCPTCERVSHVSKNTVMVACPDCKKLYDVDEDTVLER